MRGKGINYDTGFMPGNHSRPDFDPAVVASEIRVIARELGCTAVRIVGADPERIGVAARAAAAEGLEVWFSPFPVETQAGDLISLFRECASRAEQLRRDGATVVLVLGCELTLFNPGYLPGTFFYDRMRRMPWPGPRQLAAFARLPKRLNAFLAEAAQARPQRVQRTAHLRLRDLGAGRLVPLRHSQRRRVPQQAQRCLIPRRPAQDIHAR
jgi:hypothetical protein